MDPNYRNTAVRYLVFLAAACLIVSFATGPGAMVFVWVATAVSMLAVGKVLTGKNPPKPPCNR